MSPEGFLAGLTPTLGALLALPALCLLGICLITSRGKHQGGTAGVAWLVVLALGAPLVYTLSSVAVAQGVKTAVGPHYAYDARGVISSWSVTPVVTTILFVILVIVAAGLRAIVRGRRESGLNPSAAFVGWVGVVISGTGLAATVLVGSYMLQHYSYRRVDERICQSFIGYADIRVDPLLFCGLAALCLLLLFGWLMLCANKSYAGVSWARAWGLLAAMALAYTLIGTFVAVVGVSESLVIANSGMGCQVSSK